MFINSSILTVCRWR